MSRRSVIVVGLAIGLAVFCLGVAFPNDSGPPKTVTSYEGTVTARYGPVVTIKTDKGDMYSVDAKDADVLLNQLPANSMSLRVGDRLRVEGTEAGPGRINAAKVIVTLVPTEAAVTQMPSTAAGAGAGPIVDDVKLPSVGDDLGNWRSRGLVMSVRYRDRLITIATSTGTFTIDAKEATIAKASRTVSIADINEGDIIRVWGEISGLNKILADRVEVMQTKNVMASAVPIRTIALKGLIVNIDYNAFTMNIDTGKGIVKISADDNTFIHFMRSTKAFQDLKIGQMVKVAGVGNLNSGYAASEVLIVSVSRD